MEEISELATSTEDAMQLSSRVARTTYSHRIEENKPTKTKKKKVTVSSATKAEIWGLLDNDKKTEIKKEIKEPTEVVDHELCSTCKSVLIIMDDGFPTCSNVECGIIFKDILDHRPEWRFQGADDKNSADPTRCGNPINPLLEESSH